MGFPHVRIFAEIQSFVGHTVLFIVADDLNIWLYNSEGLPLTNPMPRSVKRVAVPDHGPRPARHLGAPTAAFQNHRGLINRCKVIA